MLPPIRKTGSFQIKITSRGHSLKGSRERPKMAFHITYILIIKLWNTSWCSFHKDILIYLKNSYLQAPELKLIVSIHTSFQLLMATNRQKLKDIFINVMSKWTNFRITSDLRKRVDCSGNPKYSVKSSKSGPRHDAA